MSSGSSTVTLATNAFDHGLSPAPGMAASYSSITASPANRAGSSQVAKVYRQASSLFLTRRLPEALSTLLTIIAPSAGFNAVNGEHHDPTPIASASRSARVKAWSLYLTLVDSIVNLPAEEGKATFGTQEWRELVAKVRDGRIWLDVVKFGYGGQEGEVDPDIVINLSTLLLAHSPSQAFNQQQLENYLASCANPSLDFSNVMDSQGSLSSSANSNQSRRRSQNGGTDTPRDLNLRIKILELYTLHVLPRNEEWEYARDFIRLSEILDEEKRDTFLQLLQALQDEKTHEADLQKEREAQLQREKRDAQLKKEQEMAKAARQALVPEEAQPGSISKKAPIAETDYGIDSARPKSTPRPHKTRSSGPSAPSAARAGRPGSKKLLAQASNLISAIQQIIATTSKKVTSDRGALVRLLLFLAAISVTLGRADVRIRMAAIIAQIWEKLKSTVGMGVKVSYI